MTESSWTEHTSASAVGEDARRILQRLEANGADNRILRILAGGRAFRGVMVQAAALVEGTSIPPRVRELVVLRLAHLVGSAYEWHEHEEIASRLGITPAEIDFVRDSGAQPSTLGEHELMVLAAAQSYTGGRPLSDDARAALEREWGAEAPVDFVLTCAFWGSYMPGIMRFLALD